MVWSSVNVYDRMDRVAFLFVVVDLDDYCCCVRGLYVEGGAVYVVFHVDCYAFFVLCSVVLDREGVWVCVFYKVVVC